MSEDRTRTKSRGDDPDVSGLLSDEGFGGGDDLDASAEATDDRTEAGLRGRIGSRARSVFSPRAFVVALLASAVGLVAANAVVPLPFAGLLGIFVATFLVGLIAGRSRYTETAVASGGVVAASTLSDFFVVSILGGFGLPLVAIGALAGGAVGVVGTYFGRDLRKGLTREI